MENYTEIKQIVESLTGEDIIHIDRENVSVTIDAKANRLTIIFWSVTTYGMRLVDALFDELYDKYEWELPIRTRDYGDEERTILLWGIGQIDLKGSTQYIFTLCEGATIGEYEHLYPRPRA